jgi:hypothetical protein
MPRFCGAALILGILLAAPSSVRAQAAAPVDTTPPPAATVPPVSLDGFRSAHFGMTEAEVRKAIEADFKLSGGAVRPGDNPIERTHLLSVTVPDLVPDGGKATVDYVLGFKSHTLIEVNVAWSSATDPNIKPATLVHTGGTLQGYFQAETFPQGQTAANVVLPNGALLLFRGSDTAAHTVVLLLSGPVHQDQKEHKAQMTPAALSLVYAVDPTHPDVFRLQKGSF